MDEYELYLDEPAEVKSDCEENEETNEIRQQYLDLFRAFGVKPEEIPDETAVAR